MSLPFLQEANVDGIIRVLRVTSTILDDASATAIRELHNGLSDAEMTAIISGLNLGGSGGRMISSGEDCFIILDSDGLPAPPSSHTNFLRILRWQDSTAITNVDNLMASVYWPSGVAATDTFNRPADVEMSLGVDTASSEATGNLLDRSAKLNFGVRYNGMTGAYVAGWVGAGIAMGPFFESCLRVHGSDGLRLSSAHPTSPMCFTQSVYFPHSGNDQRLVSTIGEYILGGFHTNGGYGVPGFYVGDYRTSEVNTDALLIQKTSKGYQLMSNLESDYEWINLTTRNQDYKHLVSINADEAGSTGGRYPQNHENASLCVFGAENGDNAVAAIVGMSEEQSLTGGSILQVRSYDTNPLERYNLILAEVKLSGIWDKKFRVTNIGNVMADGSYTSPASDVAEWVFTDEQYVYGTVVVVAADGTFTQSTEAEDPKVAGVIALKPGMAFGCGMDDEEPEGKRPMTVCGITPVICTTAAGAIEAGDRLVSSTNGMAQKAGVNPTAGTILGKALGSLEQPDEDPVVGELSCLVILQ